MLESVFILSICAGLIFFILAIEQEVQAYSWISILMWILVLAGNFAVEVPGDTYYWEIGFLGVALGFISINLVWIIILYFDLDYWRKKGIKR